MSTNNINSAVGNNNLATRKTTAKNGHTTLLATPSSSLMPRRNILRHTGSGDLNATTSINALNSNGNSNNNNNNNNNMERRLRLARTVETPTPTHRKDFPKRNITGRKLTSIYEEDLVAGGIDFSSVLHDYHVDDDSSSTDDFTSALSSVDNSRNATPLDSIEFRNTPVKVGIVPQLSNIQTKSILKNVFDTEVTSNPPVRVTFTKRRSKQLELTSESDEEEEQPVTILDSSIPNSNNSSLFDDAADSSDLFSDDECVLPSNGDDGSGHNPTNPQQSSTLPAKRNTTDLSDSKKRKAPPTSDGSSTKSPKVLKAGSENMHDSNDDDHDDDDDYDYEKRSKDKRKRLRGSKSYSSDSDYNSDDDDDDIEDNYKHHKKDKKDKKDKKHKKEKKEKKDKKDKKKQDIVLLEQLRQQNDLLRQLVSNQTTIDPVLAQSLQSITESMQTTFGAITQTPIKDSKKDKKEDKKDKKSKKDKKDKKDKKCDETTPKKQQSILDVSPAVTPPATTKADIQAVKISNQPVSTSDDDDADIEGDVNNDDFDINNFLNNSTPSKHQPQQHQQNLTIDQTVDSTDDTSVQVIDLRSLSSSSSSSDIDSDEERFQQLRANLLTKRKDESTVAKSLPISTIKTTQVVPDNKQNLLKTLGGDIKAKPTTILSSSIDNKQQQITTSILQQPEPIKTHQHQQQQHEQQRQQQQHQQQQQKSQQQLDNGRSNDYNPHQSGYIHQCSLFDTFIAPTTGSIEYNLRQAANAEDNMHRTLQNAHDIYQKNNQLLSNLSTYNPSKAKDYHINSPSIQNALELYYYRAQNTVLLTSSSSSSSSDDNSDTDIDDNDVNNNINNTNQFKMNKVMRNDQTLYVATINEKQSIITQPQISSSGACVVPISTIPLIGASVGTNDQSKLLQQYYGSSARTTLHLYNYNRNVVALNSTILVKPEELLPNNMISNTAIQITDSTTNSTTANNNNTIDVSTTYIDAYNDTSKLYTQQPVQYNTVQHLQQSIRRSYQEYHDVLERTTKKGNNNNNNNNRELPPSGFIFDFDTDYQHIIPLDATDRDLDTLCQQYRLPLHQIVTPPNLATVVKDCELIASDIANASRRYDKRWPPILWDSLLNVPNCLGNGITSFHGDEHTTKYKIRYTADPDFTLQAYIIYQQLIDYNDWDTTSAFDKSLLNIMSTFKGFSQYFNYQFQTYNSNNNNNDTNIENIHNPHFSSLYDIDVDSIVDEPLPIQKQIKSEKSKNTIQKSDTIDKNIEQEVGTAGVVIDTCQKDKKDNTTTLKTQTPQQQSVKENSINAPEQSISVPLVKKTVQTEPTAKPKKKKTTKKIITDDYF